MDALVAREVKGTVSRSSGFSLALTRAQADQAGGQDLADLGHALGGGHAVRIESVRQAGDTFFIGAPIENVWTGATACQESKRKSSFTQLFQCVE